MRVSPPQGFQPTLSSPWHGGKLPKRLLFPLAGVVLATGISACTNNRPALPDPVAPGLERRQESPKNPGPERPHPICDDELYTQFDSIQDGCDAERRN